MTSNNSQRTRSFFKKVDRELYFVYNGVEEYNFTKTKDSSKTDTRVKLVAGLNHFLTYLHLYRPEEEFRYVEVFIMKNRYCMIEEVNAIRNSKTYVEDLKDLIVKFCSMDDEKFVEIVCRYVVATTHENLDHETAETDITLLNDQATALHVVGVLIRFSFIFSSFLRGDMTYNQTLALFVDRICRNAFRGILKFNTGVDDPVEVDALSSAIDEFLYKLVFKHWSDAPHSNSYIEKFSTVGIDPMIYTKKNKMDMCSSLKKYIPVPINDEIKAKYIDKDSKDKIWEEN